MTSAVLELVDALREELRAETRAPGPDRLLDVASAGAMLGIGRSRLYSEMDAGRLRSIHVGRRRLVPAAAIADFIAGRTAGDASPASSR